LKDAAEVAVPEYVTVALALGQTPGVEVNVAVGIALTVTLELATLEIHPLSFTCKVTVLAPAEPQETLIGPCPVRGAPVPPSKFHVYVAEAGAEPV